jgi:hypothetical protein
MSVIAVAAAAPVWINLRRVRVDSGGWITLSQFLGDIESFVFIGFESFECWREEVPA